MNDRTAVRSGGLAITNPKIMLFALLLVYILNFLDRQIVNILAEPIKGELGLSDTQLGLLAGPAFAVFYAVLGIPIARYADNAKTNRVWLISICLAVWSAMTAICGVAQNFVQLALARIGVGVGEAGCTPAAHSLIADSVPPEKRSSAIAFFGLGIPIGGLLGLIIGGVVNDQYGWRIALMLVGTPGILLAFLLPLLIRDPRRCADSAHFNTAESPVKAKLSIRDAVREVFASKAYLYVFIAASFTAFLSYGKGLWTISFFIRSHGLSTTEAGLAMAVALGISGIIGTWLGGKMADVFGKRDKRHILTLPAIGMAIAAPILFAGYWAEDWRIAVALLILPTILNSAYYGPAYGCVQGLVRPEARAIAASLVVFGQNLIGLGMGPLLFGMLSDWLQPMAGGESVRWVLYGAAWLGLIPAFFFWRASLRLNAELKSG
ncbi:putative MFS family arabinose efflux permease [Sphingorhabdus rigui]|uniref:Putative MFS family arabinose efflux permease n=1 Tax=Sphingorhabdus rigui TaxID=1282858 RepID=A0A840B0B0_9SPHN|nr:MFS transporter [Sphingorhabdus rigui]MBB3942360.1 putative MFS family arabinose efflux permease [Sphingorhabdus rigui]